MFCWYILIHIDLNPLIPLQVKMNAIHVDSYTCIYQNKTSNYLKLPNVSNFSSRFFDLNTCTCIYMYITITLNTAHFNFLHVFSALITFHNKHQTQLQNMDCILLHFIYIFIAVWLTVSLWFLSQACLEAGAINILAKLTSRSEGDLRLNGTWGLMVSHFFQIH